MNPEVSASSEIIAYLVFALILAAVIIMYYQRKRAKKTSIETKDYWEEKQWDEYPEESLLATRTPEQIKEYYEMKEWGTLNPAYTCPCCYRKGFVRTRPTKRKKTMNGAKATGLALTGGWALLGVGLTKEEEYTQAHCEQCGSTWEA